MGGELFYFIENIHKKNELRTNVFKSSADMDEVSVNRLNFTNTDFCKKLSKKIQNKSNNRAYFGMALLFAKEIRENKADIIYSPITSPKELLNPFHADITVGNVREKGKEAPAQYAYIVQKLTDSARFYIDPDPNSDQWNGKELL